MGSLVHFIGIGGVGMSALARIMIERGFEVSGSDIRESYVTKGLVEAGAKIVYEHKKENIKEGVIVVYSTDIKRDNPEWIAAQSHRLLHRSELLEQLLSEKKGLLVVGAHGKTTTTSLLSYIFMVAGLDPAYVIGGFSPSLKGVNGRWGQGEYFVSEGDESDGSFLRASPFGAIVTNVDFDHLNYWGSEEALLEAYQKFIKGVIHKELLFYWHEDRFLSKWNINGISFGFQKGADLLASNIQFFQGKQSFDVSFRGKTYFDVKLNLLGRHNVLNALATFGMALSIEADELSIRKALCEFEGVKRRLEWKGNFNGALIYDDYAHHPMEISATLSALKDAFQQKRKVAVFQPHRYSRLRDLMEEFLQPSIWKECDELIVTDIYSAGEDRIQGVDIEIFMKKMERRATYVPRSELAKFLQNEILPDDVVVMLGAGDITAVSAEIAE